jgi:hypothetical protein
VILGVLAFLAANLAILLAASLLLARIRTGLPAVDALLFYLLRMLLISAAIVAAGLAHLLRPIPLGMAGLAASLVLLSRGAHRALPRLELPSWNRALVAFAALMGLRLLLQAWWFAPSAGDAVFYHLPKIAEWVRAGGFTREMSDNFRVYFPSGFELVETWWVVFFHHDVLIEMAGVEFLLLGCMGVYSLARTLAYGPSVALAAALLYGLTPGLYLQATSTLNDGVAAALVVATAALVLARVPLPLVVMAAGLGMGIKPTYLYAAPGLGVLYALVRHEPGLPARDRRGAAMLACLSVGVGAFWYLRNLVWFGNPVYPMGTPLVRGLQQLGPSLGSLRENLKGLVDVKLYDRTWPLGAIHSGTANWGAAAFACGMPSLLGLLRESAPIRRLTLALGVSLLTVCTLVIFDQWNARFLLFFPALPALALARVASEHRLTAALAGLAVCLEVAATCLPAEVPPARLASWARSGWRERSARPAAPPGAREEPVGCAGEEWPAPYFLYGPDFSRRVVYLRERTLPDLLARLTQEGVRTIYVTPRRAYDGAEWKEGVATGRFEAFQDALGSGYRWVR